MPITRKAIKVATKQDRELVRPGKVHNVILPQVVNREWANGEDTQSGPHGIPWSPDGAVRALAGRHDFVGGYEIDPSRASECQICGKHSGDHRFKATKNSGGSWSNVAHNTTSGKGQNPDGRKTSGHLNIRDGHDHTRHLTNPAEHRSFEPYSNSGVMDGRGRFIDPASPVALVTENDITEAVKNGGDWFGSGENCSLQRRAGSKSHARKAASAHIARIPLPLARWIARTWRPNA